MIVRCAALLALSALCQRTALAERTTADVEEALEGEREPRASSAAWRELWHGPAREASNAGRSFGQCPARQPARQEGGPEDGVGALAEREVGEEEPPAKPKCESGTLIGGFLADGTYKEECCTLPGQACAGCGAIAGGKCASCAAGYSMQGGRCVACDDLAGWKDVAGDTCIDFERAGRCKDGAELGLVRDKPFEGLTSRQACCACGGGRAAATPWRYAATQRVLLFGETLAAEAPSPLTASHFEVSKDCELSSLNASLASDGTVSGTLPAYEGASGSTVSCTVAALQDEFVGIRREAELQLTVQPMSYGPKVIVFAFEDASEVPAGSKTWPLRVAAGLRLTKGSFRARCVPDAPWVQVDPNSGALDYVGTTHTHSAGLMGDSYGSESAQCILMASRKDGKDVMAPFLVVKVFLWSAMHYPHGVYARRGRPISPLALMRDPPEGFKLYKDKKTGSLYWHKSSGGRTQAKRVAVPPAIPPEILAVECSFGQKLEKDVQIHWSRQTGVVTVEGQPALTVSPQTGGVSGFAEVQLPARLGMSSLQLECRVAAGGDFYSKTVVTTLSVRLVDDTCWYRQKMEEPVWFVDGNSTTDCSSQCRARPDCGAYWTPDGACKLQTSRQDGALEKPEAMNVRVLCEEGVSCLDLQDSNVRFLEGRYCPKSTIHSGLCPRPIQVGHPHVRCHGTSGAGYLMYSLRQAERRFAGSAAAKQLAGAHFVCVKYDNGRWYVENSAQPIKFIPEPTDVLVAAVDFGKREVKSLSTVAERLGGIRKGYALGDIEYKAVGTGEQAQEYAVTGSHFKGWECGGATAVVYVRDGVTARDELYLSHGSCPIPGRGGTWVIHRANDTDYLESETGVLELRGDFLACVDEDLEQGAFESGSVQSALWLPPAEFDDERYVDSAQKNKASELKITASLTADSCRAPTAVPNVLFGTVSQPGFYSLDPCECFGPEYRDTELVTEEAWRAVKMDDAHTFNDFQPQPQLLSEGPFVCEDVAVLHFGQKNEISEEACQVECVRMGSACRFYMYVPQLSFCTLLSACNRLGNTGLDIQYRIFGVFDGGARHCRIADPGKCWTSRTRRNLLEGRQGDRDSCAFQDVMEQCDVMKMTTGIEGASCGQCTYFPLTSQKAEGRKKAPLPESFPGGSQLSVSCGEDTSLLSQETGSSLPKSVLTCVAGDWVNEHGLAGLEKLTCSSCVQVAQPELSMLLASSAPEAYFLSKRRLQYHYGVETSGCRMASSYATAAPLRSENGHLCLQASQTPQAGGDCSTSWFQDTGGHLVSAGRARQCLLASSGKLSVAACPTSQGGGAVWDFDRQHRLRSSDGTCLEHGGGGALRLAPCAAGKTPEAQAWYFDGGDCRYSMHLRSTEKPFTWHFQLSGGGVLGNDMTVRENQPLEQAKESMDMMSFGTCRVSLQASLPQGGVGYDSLNFQAPNGSTVRDPYLKTIMATVDGHTLFVCLPGGVGGAKVVAQAMSERAAKEAELQRLKDGCEKVVKVAPKELPSRAQADLTKLRKPFNLSAEPGQVISGLFSRPDNFYEGFIRFDRSTLEFKLNSGTQDRQWSATSSAIQGANVTAGSYTVGPSTLLHTFEHKCKNGSVITGLQGEPGERIIEMCERCNSETKKDRKYSIVCSPVVGTDGTWTLDLWSFPASSFDKEASADVPLDRFLVGVKSEFRIRKEDRSFQFLTVKICRNVSKEISQLEAEIQELDAKIKGVGKGRVSCATDAELPLDKIKSLAVHFDGSPVDVTADTRCHLLHQGTPADIKAYSMTAAQAMDIARSAAYHATGAEIPTAKPFEAAKPDVMAAQHVGWFTMVDRGATVWGLQCKRGSVVMMHSDIASPHCQSVGVGAGEEDIVVAGAVTASASCERGYAVAGWYNLFGAHVRQNSAAYGGPMFSTGFRLTCRLVPGLSKLCEDQDSRCAKNQVVTGVEYEKEKILRYKCCRMPKIVGQTFADGVLRGLKPWEGYYCPAALDDTGRPEYLMQRGLGDQVSTSIVEEIWPVVRRVTSPETGGGLAVEAVLCGPGEALSQWKVQRSGHLQANKAFLAYTCIKLPMDRSGLAGLGPQGCSWRKTSPVAQVVGGNAALTLPVVQCGGGEALAGFRFETVLGSKVLCNYLCCGAKSGEGRPLRTTTPKRAPQQFRDLDDSDLTCAMGEVMVGFKLAADHAFEYTCAGVATQRGLPDRGEGKMRWDKFSGLWTLSRVPHVEHRGALVQLTKDRVHWSVACPTGFTASGFKFEAFGGGLATIAGDCRSTALDIGIGGAAAACKVVKGGPKPHTGLLSLEANTIACEQGSVVQSFAYERQADGRVELSATCCPLFTGDKAVACLTKSSPDAEVSAGYQGLADAPVQCLHGESLSAFHLEQREKEKFGFSFSCCLAKAVEQPEQSIYSAAAGALEASQEAVPARVVVKAARGFWLDGQELQGAAGSGFNVVVLAPGLQDVKEAKHFAPTQSSSLAAFLNALGDREVVLLGVNGSGLEHLTPGALFALQRLGSTLREPGKAGQGYALVGAVGAAAWAEGKPSEAVAMPKAEGKVSVSFVAAPIVDFTAAFISNAETSQPVQATPPTKPELKVFKPEKLSYDAFCDLNTRTVKMANMDCESENCPTAEHPCAHTFANQVTEQKFWNCQQRDIDREYLAGMNEADQSNYDAWMKKVEGTFKMLSHLAQIVASGMAAFAPGSWAVPAREGAKQGTEATEGTAEKLTGAELRLAALEARLAVEDAVTRSVEAVGQRALKITRRASLMTGSADIVLQGLQQFSGVTPVANRLTGWANTVAQGLLPENVAQGLQGLLPENPFALEEHKSKLQEENEEKYHTGEVAPGEVMLSIPGQHEKVPAIPRLAPPDFFGFNTAKNKKALAAANWQDCSPAQLGMSKMMCDLYCTENAVKEGHRAILQSLQDSHRVLMDNIQSLLDHHTKTLIWQFNQQSDDVGSGISNLAWVPGPERAAMGEGSVAELPEGLQAVLAELRELPRALEGALPEGNASALHPESAAWHQQASGQLLRSLQGMLEQHLVRGGDPALASQRAAELVQQFRAEQALRLQAPPPGGGGTDASLGQMTARKVARLRSQVKGERRLLEATSGARPQPLQLLRAAAPVSDEVAARWSQLSKAFVAAHEHHAVFVQARERALRAAEEAIDGAERYVGCQGEELQSLHALWQHAYRLDEEASGSLLRAWASTVAAQEHLQLAVVRQGLASRLAEVQLAGGEGDRDALTSLAGACDTIQSVADRAHFMGVRELDKALWPLLEQVLALEVLANHQDLELKSKKLSAVERLPVDEAMTALYVAAEHGANPATSAGRRLAARALNLFGPAACPAPADCASGGMLILNASGLAAAAAPGGPLLWTSARPGDLLLGKPASQVAHACWAAQRTRQGAGAIYMASKSASALQSEQGQAAAEKDESLSDAVQDLTRQFDLFSSRLVEGDGGAAGAALAHELGEADGVCGQGCEEHLRVQLSKKRSSVGDILRYMR